MQGNVQIITGLKCSLNILILVMSASSYVLQVLGKEKKVASVLIHSASVKKNLKTRFQILKYYFLRSSGEHYSDFVIRCMNFYLQY